MAEFTLNIIDTIQAAIVGGNKTMNSGDAITLDPVSESVSIAGDINFWELTIIDTGTTTFSDVLNNGKNSRFTAEGTGIVIVQLEVRDTAANSDTATIQITVT